MWYEVETKIPVSNFKELKKKIETICDFVKKENKSDSYYAISSKEYPRKAFRVRKIKNNFIINFKKKKKELYSENIVVKEEYEFSVNDLNNFLSLMKDLGFNLWLKKHKDSYEYTYKKNKRLRVELNNVQYLGWFIEIEYLCQKKEIAHAKKAIKEFLTDLDVNKKEINNTGYTKILWKKIN